MSSVAQVFPTAGEQGRLRPLNPRRDLLAVADLIELCFRESLDQSGFDHLSQMREVARAMQVVDWAFWMAEQSVKSPVSGYVWEQDGRVVGNASLISTEIDFMHTYLIANVAVHPDYRGRGIGRAVTAAAVDYAARRKLHSVWLQVSADNPSACHLYRSLGFEDRAPRTQWRTLRGALAALPPAPLPAAERLPQHWPQQLAWLQALYPSILRWNLALQPQLLRPGLGGWLQRLFSFEFPHQWSVSQGENLLGVLTWLDAAADRPNLWLAAPENIAPEVLRSLLIAARQQLGLRRSLVINLPAGLGQNVLPGLGFEPRQTLILMERALP